MSYCGYIVQIKEIRKHNNADKLQVATVFGNDVIVGLDTVENDLMVYFPTDGRLNLDYCRENNLLRIKDDCGNNVGGYMEESKCHVTTLKLRGERSDGLLMPISSLSNFTDYTTLKEGDMVTTLNGVLICDKYIPRGKKQIQQGSTIKSNATSYPFFTEHRDTSQLAYNLSQFKQGDFCYITLKMHGTSQRTALTIQTHVKKENWFQKLFGIKNKPQQTWEYISGTRRCILKNFESGYYNSNAFRQSHHDAFIGKLHQGEEVFYEVVGYTYDGATIMPSCENSKTKDKEFIKQYGKTTSFTYGCGVGQSDIYVYRMTKTDSNGDVVEYPWHLVKLRCEQMGIKHVPEFDKFLFTTEEDLLNRVLSYVDGIDPIGKVHIKEGVVVRVDNKEKFSAFKHKNFNFKVLEGIVKEDDILDIEEADEVINE